MGNKIFKKTGTRRRESIIPPNDIHIYDDKVVNKLREDLNNEPEKFLLNNIFLSIQFYENFEREMNDLRTNQVSKREMEINKALADYQKHCLLPDTVMEYINERVRFRPYHGPNKFQSETLIPQRMYIVHDNIEVQYEGETSEYSVVDGPIHRAIIEPAEKQGYVQLRQIELLNVNNQMDTQDSDVEDAQSEKSNTPSSALKDSPLSSPGVNSEKVRLFTKSGSAASSPLIKESPVFFQTDNVINEARKTSLKKKLFKSQSFSLSTSQNAGPIVKTKTSQSDENITKLMDKSLDDNYGYTTFTRISTQKPLDEVRAKRNPSDASSLSQSCITEVKERKIIPDDDNDSDTGSLLENGKRKPPVKKNLQEFYEIKKYFNSVEFFAHFGDVFANIYTLLQFTEESFRKAMAQGGAIHCEGVDQRYNKVWYEVIPTVSTPWPGVAFEWALRHRRAVLNPIDNMLYQWPTKNMVNKIKSLQSNVLPYGYVAKRGLHKNNSLEWSLAFPAAERYMLTCMSHAQIRCYLFILALYKTFMEPANTKLGLAPHHIRTLIFWEIENNYVTWPEERLGSKILVILKNLYKHLALANLPDYFIRDRNLLESTPRTYLSKSQEKLHRILERPVLHVLVAMRNIRYAQGSFFPSLNFKKLYNILSTSNSLSIVNPALAIMLENNTQDAPVEEPNEFKENKIPFWQRARNVDYGRMWKRKVRKQIELQKKIDQENLANKRKVSVDSINLKENIPPLDSIKRRALLEFFIEHLMAVATKCNIYQANKYALLILNHCQALAMLLGEEPSGEIEARTWKLKIKEKIQMCVESNEKVEVHSVRDSRQFTATTLNISGNRSLNMQNLNNTFNSINALQLGPPKKKKSRQHDIEVSAEVHTPKEERPKSVTLDNTNDTSTDL